MGHCVIKEERLYLVEAGESRSVTVPRGRSTEANSYSRHALLSDVLGLHMASNKCSGHGLSQHALQME